MKILFLIPYPLEEAPSQRFRFEQYLPLLKGHNVTIQSFLSSNQWKVFYADGHILQKFVLLISGFAKRLLIIFSLPRYHSVFIHREATPIGPPIFEWMIAKVFHKKIIYDFDDAIWMTDKTNEGWFEKTIRWRKKVASICWWSYKVSCGNDYLATYARQSNSNVVVNPTTIDTVNQHNPALYKGTSPAGRNDGFITVGWTGSHSTLKYLKTIEPVLQQLESRFQQVRFLIIADQKPALALQRLEFIPWNKETEAVDLMRIDIGIMPLPNDEWTKGKCGFKALQYMAMKIPCVVSPVGVNTQIVERGINGFCASSDEEWLQCLEKLIEGASLRKTMGTAGREVVVKEYSMQSNTENFLQLFS